MATEIRDRLSEILAHNQMSSSAFADFLEIQRSNMSHYLSGRNKPGVDILQKILDKFPDINAEWLLLGRGEMSKTEPSNIFSSHNYPPVQAPVVNKIVQNRKIDKITVYFDDGTYQDFHAESKK